MKKTVIIIILLIGVVVYACTRGNKSSDSSGIYNVFSNNPASPNELSSQLPIDVNEVFPGNGYDSFLDSIHQPPIDVFSWQTFVALNWPANASGQPIKGSITDSANAPRVWEYYSDPAEVFGHSTTGLTLRLGVAKKNGQKFFYMDSKVPHALGTAAFIDMNKIKGFKEADGHPLIDRNLNFALYEMKINPIETKFVIDSGLTTVEGIAEYGKHNGNTINLPASDSVTNNVGSMEIKAAWRILIPSLGDDTTRYYCRRATIFMDSSKTRNHKPLIVTNVRVGLVGLHIIRKTHKLTGNEIWSTFEHIDNTPDNPQEAQMSNRQWSFYNPACINCIPNAIPDTLKNEHGYLWSDSIPYAKAYGVSSPGQNSGPVYGTQAVRIYPIYKYTEQINKLWQDKLKGTVWANYRLIGSQWLLGEVHPVPTAPNNLANTTLETYIQGSASCIGCHSNASVTYKKQNITTDLSWLIALSAKSGAGKSK